MPGDFDKLGANFLQTLDPTDSEFALLSEFAALSTQVHELETLRNQLTAKRLGSPATAEGFTIQ